MNSGERLAALRVLAAVAWADGKLTGAELDSLVDFMSTLGPWEGSEIKTVLREVTQLTDEVLVGTDALPFPALGFLLDCAWRMVNQERPATSKEREIVQRVVERRLGAARWPKAEAWLEAVARADALRRELFEG